MITNYEEAIAFIHGRTQFKKSPSLGRMKSLMQRLDNPQDNITMIHVAGTNGKGSTVAFLRELFIAQGLSVGTYTSPFIVKFNERISLNGRMIDDDALLSLVNIVKPTIDQMDIELADLEGGPTEFEIITAMMFVYFGVSHPVDIVVVETGLGGKYDSTNIIDPILSVITTIGLDHMKILGDTIEKIAQQKAGIIKHNRPLVVGNVTDAVFQVITEEAEKKNSHIARLGFDFKVKSEGVKSSWAEVLTYHSKELTIKQLTVPLLGMFQDENAATAIAAFEQVASIQGWAPNMKLIRQGINATTWPGRFEKVNDEPLVVLDGAHNVAAIDRIVQLLRTRFQDKEITIIFSVLADKQGEQMLKKLVTVPNAHIILTQFAGPRKVSQLNDFDITQFKNVSFQDNWKTALVQSVHSMSTDDLLLVTGSLYFISEVRRYFIE
ncbi:bifunctional folylpolyglutamate synthase/dihydrofolate synthase [Dellaglioa algida]|uniref:Dihydrofolate synthase/folylpolyglutamate synthase n=1 Tax=Dellaglioa algida DSM 15638 TaxID=1423719 RepID=A0A0R1HIL9_9LACO|nr:folylpolyglutamate synthase/dihydrofolate synthase family protein [Dellaglioa algida]KRK46278.1 folylpolyglutamate synthase [Dellaglioa algida DSM 15638]MDK1727767.1 bifunctional folylpolyglutamate synthase/dihydrofolate synthase [Dellaglioa algida]MDK1732289.1 bifunctional folylpolyglutamate synthase/dihydrofolate synthase [Dellaglioa algida]MDK1733815.1 bifunctional folylpolyglutamate synthase/dihydrofolate synthase [Dellaglioa algida]MDK1735107.1 bifunctional folylpolyglutamate synthase/